MPSGGNSPASSSLRTLSSYCAAVKDAGVKRIRTLIGLLLRWGSGRPYLPVGLAGDSASWSRAVEGVARNVCGSWITEPCRGALLLPCELGRRGAAGPRAKRERDDGLAGPLGGR